MNTESLTIYLNADPQTRSLIDELASQLVTSQRELELSRKAGSAIMTTAQSQADELTALRSELEAERSKSKVSLMSRAEIIDIASQALSSELKVEIVAVRNGNLATIQTEIVKADGTGTPVEIDSGDWLTTWDSISENCGDYVISIKLLDQA